MEGAICIPDCLMKTVLHETSKVQCEDPGLISMCWDGVEKSVAGCVGLVAHTWDTWTSVKFKVVYG